MALTVYAVLPILRGAITGIQGVAAPVIECAVAMGLTPRQILRQVEWPLALPSIVSGLRVAVVIGVGTATIASAIGAGGLGDYIFRGLAMVDSTVILAGAVPAALLALVCDAALALAGRIAGKRSRLPAGLPTHDADRRGRRRSSRCSSSLPAPLRCGRPDCRIGAT